MNKRSFLKYSFLFVPMSLLFKPKDKPIKVIYKGVPKTKVPDFDSLKSFYYTYYSQEDYNFSVMKNIQNGKILNVEAQLSSNKKAVITKTVYRDKFAFIECLKDWRKRNPKHKDPLNNSIIDIMPIS